MLDCFDGLISLDGTCAGNSGVMSLQTLDGMSESLLKDITGAEDTPASMLAQCEAWARACIYNRVIQFYLPRFTGRTFIDRKSIGDPDDNQELITGATGIGGILVEIDQPGSNAILRLGRLGLWADFTGDVTITIYDLEDGSVAATYTITLVAGVSKTEDVQIALPAYRKRKAYFITHDRPDYYRTWVASSCGSCQRGYSHGGVTVNGARLPVGLSKKKSNPRLSRSV